MKEQIIKTVDEEGNEVGFRLIDIVNYDDQDYALVLPEDADPDAEDAEVLLMRMTRDGDECTLEVIEDDDEFDLVAQAIMDAEEEEEG